MGRSELFRVLDEKDLSAIIISTPLNVRYISKFRGTGLVIFCRDEAILVTDPLHIEQAKKETKGISIHLSKNPLQKLCEILEKKGLKRVGFEEEAPFSLYNYLSKKKDLSLVPIKELDRIRARKKKFEVKLIRKSIEIAEKSFFSVLELINEGVRECELSNYLEIEMKKRGADGSAFPTICLFGKNTSLVHGIPKRKKLEPNSPILFDFGSSFWGYCCDETAMAVFGKPDPLFKTIYQIVRDAQKFAFDKIRDGVLAKEVDKAARSYIESKGYGKNFCHSLGHGVGLCVHEYPKVSSESKHRLLEGMIFTVEPGIYIEGNLGIRLEDMVLVEKDGFLLLTSIEKDRCFMI